MTWHQCSTILCLLFFCTAHVKAQDYFAFHSYHDEQLYMTLVTSSTQGELMIDRGNEIAPLHGAKLSNLFTLRVRVPCEQLAKPVSLYWLVSERVLQTAKVPAQQCAPPKPSLPPVQIVIQADQCMINTRGNTLWRTATELARRNGASIYQNIYGLFLTNKAAFEDEDVLRLNQRILQCPDAIMLAHIEPEHARRLFADAVAQ